MIEEVLVILFNSIEKERVLSPFLHKQNKTNMNKIKIILSVIFLLALLLKLNSQTVTISSNTPTTLTVFQPLDNSFNKSIKTSEVELKPNLSLVYNFDFPDFGYVVFQIKETAVKITVALISNTNLYINIIDGVFEIKGDNAQGISFFNNTFVSQGFQEYTQQIGSLYNNNIDSYPNKYEELSKLIYNGTFKSTLSILDSLQNNNNISLSFHELMRKDIELAINTQIIDKYIALSKTKLPNSNSINIKNEINRLFSQLMISDNNILMYYYSPIYINSYYKYKYRNKESMHLLRKKHDVDLESTFGPYYIYLFAPDYIMLPRLSTAIIIQRLYGVNEFNADKLYNYLVKRFPKSEYLDYLSTDFKVKEVESNIDPIIIKKQINTLKELTDLPELKGSYILIDLWATWCAPCKVEFQKKEALYNLLSKYNNIKLAYISIDEDRFASYWEKSIKDLELEGVHIKTNNSLYKEIEKEIYGNKPFLIPQYFLMDPNGNVIDKELPRLDEIEEMEKILSVL